VLGSASDLVYGGAVLLSPKARRVAFLLVGGGLAVALVLSGLASAAFFALTDKLLCDHIVTDFPSPTGRYIASYDIVLCRGGAIGAVYYDVNLRRASDPFWVESTLLYTTSYQGQPRVEWRDAETLVIEHRAERHTLGPEQVGQVHIVYRRVTGSAARGQVGGRSVEPTSAE
jgi:hypothetical protein